MVWKKKRLRVGNGRHIVIDVVDTLSVGFNGISHTSSLIIFDLNFIAFDNWFQETRLNLARDIDSGTTAKGAQQQKRTEPLNLTV